MTDCLTTHVLDLSCGKPAHGVEIELWKINASGSFQFIEKAITNEDGRVDQPLLCGIDMKAGCYELRFFIGNYYRKQGHKMEEPVFLDCVPVRFGISHSISHYHVPLLISPGGYSTYRGS
ncbi:hydroxyisourate hydrolase [Bacillus taeanensis]|uniref:5-hydroxyisourate hydrolase n=1 Tax=Bacillus taeanensis TaxID=273032 RepID=A0A366XTT8_9BACI|nr:hydroxyisourate hydrolase [Bacillus taeanensis]RBW69780.1 hydroxyisourate hydrolase [Bacillus taeanensis]